jgi:hypothetical protein
VLTTQDYRQCHTWWLWPSVFCLFVCFFCKQQSCVLYQNTVFKTSNMTLAVNDNTVLYSCVYSNWSSRKMYSCQTRDLGSDAQDLSLNKQQLIHSRLSRSWIHCISVCWGWKRSLQKTVWRNVSPHLHKSIFNLFIFFYRLSSLCVMLS